MPVVTKWDVETITQKEYSAYSTNYKQWVKEPLMQEERDNCTSTSCVKNKKWKRMKDFVEGYCLQESYVKRSNRVNTVTIIDDLVLFMAKRAVSRSRTLIICKNHYKKGISSFGLEKPYKNSKCPQALPIQRIIWMKEMEECHTTHLGRFVSRW